MMKAREYVNNVTAGGYDQAEYVAKEDALKAVEMAKAEGWNEAVNTIRKTVHHLCNVRQVLECLDKLTLEK